MVLLIRLSRTSLKTKWIAKRTLKLTAKGLLMLKDFVDSDGYGRLLFTALKCVETTVTSGCPKWKQVGNGKVLMGNRINASFIPSLLLASAYGYGLI